jgi:predicted Zn-ribbon and HTH transcriptional regulator
MIVTQDNKDKIYKIVREHLEPIDILRVVEIPIQTKANRIYQELEPIFNKLDAEKLLPEDCNKEVFHKFVTHILEYVANSLLQRQAFFI